MPVTPEQEQALVREAAQLMGKLLISRKDRKAVYRPDHKGNWHWTAVAEPFKMGDFKTHLTDSHCLGTYLLAEDSTVKFLAIDLDLAKNSKYMPIEDPKFYDGMDEAQCEIALALVEGDLESSLHVATDPAHKWARIILLEAIRAVTRSVRNNLQLDCMTVITGGGAHVIVPLPEPTPAVDARSAGMAIVGNLPGVRQRNNLFFDYGANNELSIEVFPKQDSMDGKNYGNLIRLPFGWHYEAGIRTYTIDPDAQACPNWEWSKTKSLATMRALAQKLGAA